MEKRFQSIDASLKYGQFFTGKWLIFFYSIIVVCALLIVISIIYLFLVIFGLETFKQYTFISLICSNTIFLLVILGVAYVLYRNNKLKKKILLWLEDAVELTAQTTTLDRFRTLGHPVAETKLQVEFTYNGSRIIQSSYDITRPDHWYKRNGYYKILSKYADRTIHIFYSPKFEQVLLLKSK